MKEKILIIDDDREYAEFLALSLKKEFDVLIAVNQTEARDHLLVSVDAVLLDINFAGKLETGDTSGFVILEELRARFLLLPVIMLSGYQDPAIIIEAFRKGASDYIIKGKVDILELKALILQHLEKTRRMRAAVEGGEEIEFIGTSQKTKSLKEEIARISAFDTTVFITGETGVGKEVAARYLHHHSSRSRQPFVPVSIASLSPTVVEAELFGYKKGAFTGAASDRKGYFEVADGGTLFLDEIGELSSEVQVKLLRFLEDMTVYPIGSPRPIPVNTRLVCATNKDLAREVENKRFRDDLFYRINVYAISIPPLRERKEDVPVLISHFLKKFSREHGEPVKPVNANAMDLLTGYHWQGNIRELRNVIESALIKAGMEQSAEILSNHLPIEIRKQSKNAFPGQVNLDGATQVDMGMNRLFVEYAEQAMQETMGNKKEAALQLGLKDDEALRYRLKTISKKYPHLFKNKPWLQRHYPYFVKLQ